MPGLHRILILVIMKKKAVEYKISATKQDFSIAKIKSSEDSFKYAKQFYFDDINIFESCFIMLLNNANNVMGFAKISQGGLSSTTVDVRLIAKYAIEVLASSVIIVHNHPSGDVNPSYQDDKITEMAKQGLQLLNIKLLDHLVITEDKYYSYIDEGRI